MKKTTTPWRSHPIGQLLTAATAAQKPTKAELDALPLDERLTFAQRENYRAEIRDAANAVVALRSEGNNDAARALAEATAKTIIDQASTDEWRPAAAPLPTDPAALADHVVPFRSF